MACGPSYGFETISIHLTTYGSDRPVTALCYEIAASTGDPLPDPAVWADTISRALSTPREASFREVPDYADPAGSVRYSASWPLAEHSVAISAYGAPRKAEHGLAAGCLWLNWAILPAAQPFLQKWRARAADLHALASTHSGIVSFLLAMPQQAAFGYVDGAAERDAHHALMRPELLPTPKPIADALGAKGIAFWRSGNHSSWCASTKWDSIAFGLGQAVTVDWHDVLPAKGGGFSEIQIDGWNVRDLTGSRAVKDAIAALASIPGVSINHVESHDC